MNGKRKSVPVAGPTVIVSTVFLVLLCDGQWSRRASIIDVDLVFMARKRSAVVNRKNIQFVTIGRKSTMSIVFVSAFYMAGLATASQLLLIYTGASFLLVRLFGLFTTADYFNQLHRPPSSTFSVFVSQILTVYHTGKDFFVVA